MRIRSVSLALLLLLPRPAGAQDLKMLEGLFRSLNSFTISMQTGTLQNSPELTSSCGLMGLCGMGTEVFINLPSPAESLLLELALGTSYLRGFEAREPSLDLYGAVRSRPTVALYLTKETVRGSDALQPYTGVSFGFSDLWNVRAYDRDGAQYALDGQTYDYGVALGVFSRLGAFVETSYKRRNFASVHWSFPASSGSRLPANWPRKLELNGWLLSVGWQFSLATEGRSPAASLTSRHHD